MNVCLLTTLTLCFISCSVIQVWHKINNPSVYGGGLSQTIIQCLVSAMDPFSFAASIITVIGATKTGINGIKKLRGAPQELDDLLADISQFEIVLRAVQNIRTHDNADSELKKLLESGSKKMVELDSLVQYQLTKAGESSKVDRFPWIRNGNDVERLRGQLRDVIANLVALIGVNTR